MNTGLARSFEDMTSQTCSVSARALLSFYGVHFHSFWGGAPSSNIHTWWMITHGSVLC